MLSHHFHSQSAVWRSTHLPELEALAAWLETRGHRLTTIQGYLRSATHLLQCLDRGLIGLEGLTADRLQHFARRHEPVCRCSSPRKAGANFRSVARHLFRVLDERHHLSKPAPPPPPETPTEKLLGCFDGFLRDTKGLRPTTRARLLRERMRRYAVYSEDQSVVSDTTAMVPFAFDQTHSLNLVAGYQFPLGWKVSANFHLNSGRPESGEFSSRTQRVVTDPATGSRAWSPVPLGEVERLPAFARVDARVSKTFTFEEATLELYLDVFSVSFSSEVYGYSYGFDDQLAPLRSPFAAPVVLPTLGVKVVY